MATASYTFSGSTVPVGVANATDLAEGVANINILYHKYLEDWVAKHSVMKMFYQLRYEGPAAGTDFTVSESMTGTGVAHETDEDAEPWAGDIAHGYSKNVVVRERTYSLAITWFFSYHNRYPEQEQNIIRGAAQACAARMEFDMAAPFTYSTATTYTNIDGRSVNVAAGDTLSLANASHTITNGSSTYRNRLSTDPQLSKGALELAENLFLQVMIDNNGNPAAVAPDTIVTASDMTTFNIARTLVRSAADPNAPNPSVFNPYQGIYRVVRAPSIDRTFTVGGKNFTFDSTKQKQWMLFDSTNPGLYLLVTLYPTVMAPTVSNGGVQYLTGTKTWVARTVYEPAVVDPRCCVISVVTTA